MSPSGCSSSPVEREQAAASTLAGPSAEAVPRAESPVDPAVGHDAATAAPPHFEDGGADAALGALPEPLTIMPLGDSLTSGFADATAPFTNLDGGYRIHLRDSLGDRGYSVDYVGTQQNGPDGFDRDHESYPGAPIADVSQHWQDAHAAGLSPHVVLLMAGTNDQLGVTANHPPDEAADALARLIDRILADVPEAQLVVARPPPLGPGLLVGAENPGRMLEYGALVAALVAERVARGARVHFADLSDVDPALFGDGVHPTTMEGYDLMAERWIAPVVEAIEALRQP